MFLNPALSNIKNKYCGSKYLRGLIKNIVRFTFREGVGLFKDERESDLVFFDDHKKKF
jgi:hypothetical protein